MARDPEEEPEAGTEAAPGLKGFSLRTKFSLVVILTLAAMVAGASTVFYSLALERLDHEVDKRGAGLATSLADLGTRYWNAVLATGQKEVNRTLQDYTRLPAMEHEVFNIILLSDKGALAAARPSGDASIEGGTEGSYAAAPAIMIRRDCLFLEAKLRSTTPARVFTILVKANSPETSIKTPDGGELPPVASLKLVMNAEEIDKAKATLRNSVLVTTGVAIGLGAVVAFWMASFVTGPLRLLMKDIHTVGAGNLDHRTRPHSKDEIGELAETFNHFTVMMRAAREAEMAQRAMEHDLTLARDIQSNLLPKRIPKIRGMDIQAFYRAAKEVGGDYYDLIPLTAQHLGVAVGDVAGKGVQGSLVMAMTRAVIRAVAPGVTSASKTLTRANHILAKDLKPGSFITLCFLVVDVVGRTLNVGRAGHNPLLIVHGETRKPEFLNPGGIALGFDKGPIFERTIKEATVPLHKGDVIVAYTDGVVESMNEAKEQYGNERFQELVAAKAQGSADAIVKALVAELDRHQGSAPQHDDITIVVLKVL